MKIERISSQNGSPRCPVCKAHIAPEDIECPICGAALTPNKPSGRALPAARDPKTTQSQPPVKAQPRKPQTGGFRPFQPSSLTDAKPAAKLAAPDAAVPSAESNRPITDAEFESSGNTKADAAPAVPGSSVPPDASPTRPVRRLKSVDGQPTTPANPSNPIRRAVPARGLNARPNSEEVMPMRSTGTAPTTGSNRRSPISKEAAAAAPPSTRPAPRLKPPPGGARKQSFPVISLSPRIIGIIVGVLALVGVGFGLMRLGTSILSRSSPASVATTNANPSFQAKVVFAQGSPTPDSASASAALAVTETVVASETQLIPTATDAGPAAAVVVPETPTPEVAATATSEATATAEATATTEATDTPAPTATSLPTALPSATPKALPTATAAAAVAESTAFINYTVKSGDTCDAVAKANGISTASLAAANVLDAANCDLKAGATIRIPRAPAATPTAAGASASDPSAKPDFEIQTQYTVQQGDTCGGIAYRFKITAAQLVAANKMSRSSCFLRVGQKLWIPKSDAVIVSPTSTALPTNTSGTRNYTVQQGDVCGSIAKRFGITVALLAAANNLDPNVCPLRVGRTLVIPNP